MRLSRTLRHLRAEFTRLGLNGMQDWAQLTPAGLCAALQSGALRYVPGTRELDETAVRVFLIDAARDTWTYLAYDTCAAPYDYPTDEAYLAACKGAADAMVATGLFTPAQAAEYARPFTRGAA